MSKHLIPSVRVANLVLIHIKSQRTRYVRTRHPRTAAAAAAAVLRVHVRVCCLLYEYEYPWPLVNYRTFDGTTACTTIYRLGNWLLFNEALLRT